jgi:hypothetical protein
LRPDFLIIGAEKAGTTWLYDVLRIHPSLFLPDTKEIHFFNRFDSNLRRIDRFETRGLDWYERHFAGARPGMQVGEATPMYLCDPAAPARIHRTLPYGRFIVLLRDPVSRTWSHYRMARAKGHVSAGLDQLIDREDQAILHRGLYAAQFDRWRALFPRDRFLILFFEEVMAEPEVALTRVADWLGVAPDPLMQATPGRRRNAATGYRSPAVYRASVAGARGLRQFPPTRALARRMKAAGLYDLLKRANRAAVPDLTLTEANRAALQAFFRDDVRRLATDHGLAPPWPAFVPQAADMREHLTETGGAPERRPCP